MKATQIVCVFGFEEHAMTYYTTDSILNERRLSAFTNTGQARLIRSSTNSAIHQSAGSLVTS